MYLLFQESAGACVTAFFWLSAGHVPYCFVVLYIREDAPLALLPALPKEHSSRVFLAAGGLNGVPCSIPSLNMSPQTKQSGFASVGVGCIFLGGLTILIPQGTPYALRIYAVLGKKNSQFLMENCLADKSGSNL